MSIHDKKRISRLSSITTYLQSKSSVTATELASRYSVSIRTIYRDIRALEAAGIPIYTEEGKGYKLVEGFRLPPVRFSEEEANALVAAEQLVMRSTDSSLVKDFTHAIEKIKSILSSNMKKNLELLSQRMIHSNLLGRERTSAWLSILQYALSNLRLCAIEYEDAAGQVSQRRIEPFALLSTNENWLMVAYCQLRKDYRYFRLDRIVNVEVLEQTFPVHKLTLEGFFNKHE